MSAGLRAALVAVVAGLTGCTDFGTPSVPMRPQPSRFDTQVQPILSASCAVSSCHAPPLQESLDLRAGMAYDHLVGVPSRQMPALDRIRAGDLDASYLLRKISDCTGCYLGARMPRGMPPLAPAQIQVLRDWVAAGAPE